MNSGRRSPHGERGLKFDAPDLTGHDPSRSPHGERGLKYVRDLHHARRLSSLSSRRAWIEIRQLYVSLGAYRSLSSRRAWIEIFCLVAWCFPCLVALLTESVD